MKRLAGKNFLISAVLAALFIAPVLAGPMPYTPVVTPDGATLPWKMENGVKVFHLIAAPCTQEMAPGLVVNAWCYNGRTPGPTIEAVEGDRVRILVTNHLPEPTSIHWHGIHVPNGMDGVEGLTQPDIKPGETYAYEFTLRQHGTFMYHPHADELKQVALGLMGFFIVHPKKEEPKIDRDYAIMLDEWALPPGSKTPDPNVMTDFNLFTFNGKVYPGTSPLLARKGDRVRLRFGNLSMDSHPIHLHGYSFKVVATDGGDIPSQAQWPETTINVPPGTTRDVEFVADADGDWVLHCHKSHHTMNMMTHGPMGENGMAGMAAKSSGLPNTIPMVGGQGPFGSIAMGGMFTILKVRDHLNGDKDPGWYQAPPGTRAWKVSGPSKASKTAPAAASSMSGMDMGN